MHDLTSDDDGNEALPTVTVVTVVLNCVQTIERTLRSVVDQDYPGLEYIVIDGCSTDGTVDVIRRYDAGITRWVSVRDTGPYDAMNKGTALASGEWIIFMNGGDRFVANDVVRQTFSRFDFKSCDVIYGDGIVTQDGNRTLVHAPVRLRLEDGNGFLHQSAFVRTSLQIKFGFDLRERIAADYDFFLRLRGDGAVFRKANVVVSEFFMGGLSTIPRDAAIRLRHRVYKKHFHRSDFVLYVRLSTLRCKEMAKRYVPTSLWRAFKHWLDRKNAVPLGGQR